jgi:hypothetical protein
MYERSLRRVWRVSAVHTSGELCIGKRTPDRKWRSMVEFWVMALRARARRVQKAVFQETGLGGLDGVGDGEARQIQDAEY